MKKFIQVVAVDNPIVPLSPAKPDFMLFIESDGIYEDDGAGNKTKLISSAVLARAELDDIRAKFQALLAKLDADPGVAAIDFSATLSLNPPLF